MSMRILFADDSMTAQNMGKKILTEAGYEVVAVSNGAAAVKKIAEQKPDIVILDIYMPGYTGLEVCDKLRASVDTLKIPVLLTVGKMEPYRAEDANRVRADGVIIKPFEASDLLAVIKKLEERVAPKTVAITEQTILLERPPDFTDFAPLPSETHVEIHSDAGENSVPAIVDVPDNMATSAAFSDLLGPEPAHYSPPLAVPAPVPVVAEELPVVPEPPVEPPVFAPPPATAIAEEAIPVSGPPAVEHIEVPEFSTLPPEDVSIEEPETLLNSVEASHAPVISTPSVDLSGNHESEQSGSFPDTQPIPVYQEPEVEHAPAVAATPEIASAPSPVTTGYTDDFSVEPENPAVATPTELQSPSVVEPVDSFSAKVEAETEVQQIETAVLASEAHHIDHEMEVTPADNGFPKSSLSPEVPPSGDDDFEARVAAAMSIYDEPVAEKVETPTTLVEDVQPESSHSELESMVEPIPEPASLEPTYSFEYSPPIKPAEIEPVQPIAMAKTPEPATVEIPITTEPVIASTGQKPEPVESAIAPYQEVVHTPEHVVAVEPIHSRVDDEQILSEIEAQLPTTAAAAAESTTDTQVIASVIHRVLERLKPQLIEEISKELKKNK